MTCNCIQTNSIPSCLTNLTVGTISYNNESVNVFVRSDATGRVNIFQTTSSNTGEVSFDLTVDDLFLVGHSYTAEVKLGFDTVLPVTVGSETEMCISITFETMLDENGNSLPVTSHTLTVK